jgi:type IV pilus assembly protein PilB
MTTMSAPTRLGDLLVRAGVVPPAELQAAIDEQSVRGGRLGSILVRRGVLGEDVLVLALCQQLGLPRANLDAVTLPAAVRAVVDRATCEAGCFLPLQVAPERHALIVAVADPQDTLPLEALGRRVGLRIEICLAGERSILSAIAKVFAEPAGMVPPEVRAQQNVRALRVLLELLVEKRAISRDDVAAVIKLASTPRS